MNTLRRIIVGVKYCFRYNQRNRQQRNDENGEPIDMTAMPRTHRRRREKKLMTMDEVNDRFPLTKYKAWVTRRAEEGLSTEGGVASPRSRPASLKNIEGVLVTDRTAQKSEEGERLPTTPSGPSPSAEVSSVSKAADSASPGSLEKSKDSASAAKEITPSSPILPSSPTQQQVREDDDMDDDDQIQIAVPTEMLATPGDSCAICLDTLEEDDDVRGLTCGHAFHASCVDPWLTSRRACCPLCKTDYHVPKPRPEGEAAADGDRHAGRRAGGPHGGRDHLPNPPELAFAGGRTGGPFRPRLIFPGRFMSMGYSSRRERRPSYPVVARLTRPPTRRPGQENVATPVRESGPNVETGSSPSWRSRIGAWRPKINLPNNPLRRNNNNNNNNNPTASDGAAPPGGEIAATAPTGVSPGQLEAGVR